MNTYILVSALKRIHLFYGRWWCFDFQIVVELAPEISSVTMVIVILVTFAVSFTFVIFTTTTDHLVFRMYRILLREGVFHFLRPRLFEMEVGRQDSLAIEKV